MQSYAPILNPFIHASKDHPYSFEIGYLLIVVKNVEVEEVGVREWIIPKLPHSHLLLQ
jgi:hypothetical protein